MIKKRIKEIRDYIFAENENFPLEHRILLSAIIVGILMSTIGGIINYITFPSLIVFIILLFISVLLLAAYYFVRFKNIVKPVAIPVIVIAIFGVSTIWILNGGINGSDIMPAFIILILGILVVPNKIKKYILILFIVMNISILLLQFYRPDLIINFPTEKARWIDNIVTLIFSSYFIYMIISFVHKNYTRERLKAEMSEIRLHQLNADKDRFISILGHDLKNPFNSILGFSELLSSGIDSLNSDEIKEIAGHINKSARITNNLLEAILMWARTQQGKIPFNPQNLRFADICMNILEVLNPNAKEKNITINYSSADHINVFADIDMLNTVLRNLVSNAIKFTSNGGAININAEENSDNVIISVSDNGIGIAQDELNKLFDISEVLTTKGTAGETGTGLGLMICKEFVEKHNGKIWVKSKEGFGSTFIFTLPIKAQVKK